MLYSNRGKQITSAKAKSKSKSKSLGPVCNRQLGERERNGVRWNGGREGGLREGYIYIYTYVDFSYKFRIFKKLQSTLKIPTLSLILQQIKQNKKKTDIKISEIIITYANRNRDTSKK